MFTTTEEHTAAGASLSPALFDLRVDHIPKAERHPDGDSLYVNSIACGDQLGSDNTSIYEGTVVRTVCSGWTGKMPTQIMQEPKIIAVCNLKPVKMRGILFAAMVLAVSLTNCWSSPKVLGGLLRPTGCDILSFGSVELIPDTTGSIT